MKKSTVLHLRFPFSFFLLPIFLFACTTLTPEGWWRFALVFFILHFLLYPASNGYNSYFDKDEQSIGGLKFPPKVSKELYWAALVLDFLALMLGFLLSEVFVLMLLVYGLISKAYSHPAFRWKAKPYMGWLAAGIFQGYFTFLMTVLAVGNIRLEELWSPQIQFGAVLSTLMLFGSYPMTQVYQHEEDQQRGDITISLKLGILGTFHFTGLFFSMTMGLFGVYFLAYFGWLEMLVFYAALSPVLLFFTYWYFKVRKDRGQANYDNTMKLNWISASCFVIYFIWLLLS